MGGGVGGWGMGGWGGQRIALFVSDSHGLSQIFVGSQHTNNQMLIKDLSKDTWRINKISFSTTAFSKVSKEICSLHILGSMHTLDELKRNVLHNLQSKNCTNLTRCH